MCSGGAFLTGHSECSLNTPHRVLHSLSFASFAFAVRVFLFLEPFVISPLGSSFRPFHYRFEVGHVGWLLRMKLDGVLHTVLHTDTETPIIISEARCYQAFVKRDCPRFIILDWGLHHSRTSTQKLPSSGSSSGLVLFVSSKILCYSILSSIIWRDSTPYSVLNSD